MAKEPPKCPECGAIDTRAKGSIASIVFLVLGGLAFVDLATQLTTGGPHVTDSLTGTSILLAIGIVLWPFGKFKCKKCGKTFRRSSTSDE